MAKGGKVRTSSTMQASPTTSALDMPPTHTWIANRDWWVNRFMANLKLAEAITASKVPATKCEPNSPKL